MISLDAIINRLNTGIALTPSEMTLILRELLKEVNKLKESVNELKVSAPKPGVDSNIEGALSAPPLRRKNVV